MSTTGSPPSQLVPVGATPSGGAAPAPGPQKPRATGWLTTFAIIAIALGAMTIVGGLANIVTPRFLAFQTNMMRDGSGESPAARAQAEMSQASIEIYGRYQGTVRANAVGGTLFGALLVVGGIGCLGLRRWSRWTATAGFVATLLLNLGTAPATFRMRAELAEVNNRHLQRIFDLGNAGKPEVQQVARTMGSFVRVTAKATTIGTMVVTVLVIAACLAGAIFMLHPRTRARFQPAPPA